MGDLASATLRESIVTLLATVGKSPFCLTRNVAEMNSQEAMIMKRNTLQDLLEQIRPRYARSTKKEKQRILDEFVATTGYHRKHAVRLLRHGLPEKRRQRRRKSLYPATLDAILVRLAEILGWPASGMAGSMIPLWPTPSWIAWSTTPTARTPRRLTPEVQFGLDNADHLRVQCLCQRRVAPPGGRHPRNSWTISPEYADPTKEQLCLPWRSNRTFTGSA